MKHYAPQIRSEIPTTSLWEQVAGRHPQGTRQPRQLEHGHVPNSSLNTGHERPVNPSFVGETLLRPSALFAGLPHTLAKHTEQWLTGLRHATMLRS